MITICGFCGQANCTCIDKRFAMPAASVQSNLVSDAALNTALIVLPDIVECARFGQQIKTSR